MAIHGNKTFLKQSQKSVEASFFQVFICELPPFFFLIPSLFTWHTSDEHIVHKHDAFSRTIRKKSLHHCTGGRVQIFTFDMAVCNFYGHISFHGKSAFYMKDIFPLYIYLYTHTFYVWFVFNFYTFFFMSYHTSCMLFNVQTAAVYFICVNRTG